MDLYSVVGADGRIGRAIIHALSRRANTEIYCVPRNFTKSNLASLGHVIFAAGLTSDFRNRPYDTMRAHIEVVSQILEYGSYSSLTYLSSCRVYMNADSTLVDAKINIDPANFSDIYTISKLGGEALCMQAGERVFIARLSNVVGANEVGEKTFLGILTEQAVSGSIVLETSANSSKDYIWLNDAVDLLIDMPFKAKQKCYNIASGKNISNQAWAEAIKSIMNCEYCYSPNAPEIVHPNINIESTVEDFKFSPRSPIEKINEICKL